MELTPRAESTKLSTMYGKLYESCYTGSLLGVGLNVHAVWPWIIANEKNGWIEINPDGLAFILGGAKQRVEPIDEALEFLQAPDPKSRSQKEYGRRLLKKGPYLYYVVNWEEYRKIQKEEDLKEYNRLAQAAHRAKDSEKKLLKLRKAKPLPGETAAMQAIKAGKEAPEGDACLVGDECKPIEGGGEQIMNENQPKLLDALEAAASVLEECDCCGDTIGLSGSTFTGRQVLCAKCNSQPAEGARAVPEKRLDYLRGLGQPIEPSDTAAEFKQTYVSGLGGEGVGGL